MVRIFNYVFLVVICLSLQVSAVFGSDVADKLSNALSEYQNKASSMDSNNDKTNSDYYEYSQVYNTLGGYYDAMSAINADKKGFLLTKASELSNQSYESMKESSKNPFFANSEGSVNFFQDADGDSVVDFSFLTVIPLMQSPDLKHTWFTQLSTLSVEQFEDRRITSNVGLGYRNYNSDFNLVLGVNSFYDHEFETNHNRVGFGGEIKKGLLDLNINYYFALSGKKKVKIDSINGDERALTGVDAEVGHPLPFLPWTKAFFSYYFFDGEKVDDPYGFRYSSELYLSDYITAEVGYNDDQQEDKIDQQYWFVKLTIAASPTTNPTLFGTNSQPYSTSIFGYRDVKSTLVDKVRRRNKITLERIQTGSMEVGGN